MLGSIQNSHLRRTPYQWILGLQWNERKRGLRGDAKVGAVAPWVDLKHSGRVEKEGKGKGRVGEESLRRSVAATTQKEEVEQVAKRSTEKESVIWGKKWKKVKARCGAEKRRRKMEKMRRWVGEMGAERGIKYLKVKFLSNLLQII